ncbi:peroxiredoxin [Flavobacterium aquatile]|uniref:thioredoxin-dependent peroxiredoxin n=1 Tax=Flavobacterium aquatile LMG 4008 = ATCC 11947 TaxID=1453498 RepID=A0A095SUZ7_9FLAO|nr:peroxiredoxin [Flavobacterium aquatile]KGD68179.1 alkyl hydroperoxide reductase [Flavobacterium aquatile LMG 4008 = ATCC 11947]OXA68887.1 peroxiredoxin [Flavobacterium aquatile] [Flavobacterium aquatile LMG 4008 = ATCC 11947]GEC77351.1 peroxiredoxin [Flavobacterium aquatile]
MALKVGDKLPNFKAKDTNGNLFDSQDYIGKQPLVIYFYPKDETKVCTEQACSFRDNYEEFKEFGAEIIGISADSVQSHLKFKSKFNLPFILLSDNDKKIRKLFQVENDFLIIPGRQTFVANKEGEIVLVFNSMSGKIHIEKALKIVQKMTK